MKPQLLSAFLMATAVLVSGCGGVSEPGPSPATTATSTPSVSVSPVPRPSPSPTPSATNTDQSDEEAIVEDLLREPGPFGGSAFVLDAAVEAIKEKDPQSAEESAAAVVDLTHGDYAEATQGLLDFSPGIDDDPARPVEKLGDVDVVGQNHFAVVLDASGSMAETSGGITRMQEAKAAVEAFASQLPDSSTLTLRVYGHKGSNASADKAESCAATEVVYEGSPSGVGEAMAKFEPTGWTPLGAAILAARQDTPAEASDAIVYVVTDGLETCGGDPVEAARQLAADGVKPVVNVIGFQVGDADQAELRRIAEAGGGDFIDARSGADLKDYWQEERTRMTAAWKEWKDQALTRINEQGTANIKLPTTSEAS